MYPDYHDLRGKRAVVTACTAGIGREVALALAFQGCHVALLSRSAEKLAALKKELEDAGVQGNLRMQQVAVSNAAKPARTVGMTTEHRAMVDMNDISSVCQSVREAIQQLGGLDVLVINSPGHTADTFAARHANDDIGCAEVHFRVNTLATMAAYNAALPAMKVRLQHLLSALRSGDLVLRHGTYAGCGRPVSYICPIRGAKLGIEAWAAGKAVAEGKHGIRVNCIRPGVTVTAIWDAAKEAMGADSAAILAMTAAQTPLRRNAAPADVAAAVLFLASSTSSFVTGTTITVDGGWSLMHPITMGYLDQAPEVPPAAEETEPAPGAPHVPTFTDSA